jgi:hypothetical protein
MRKGDWKIHLYHEEWILNKGNDRFLGIELYNLQTDEGETTDLSKSNPKKRDELLKELLVWIKEKNAKLPVPIDATHLLNDSDGAGEEH